MVEIKIVWGPIDEDSYNLQDAYGLQDIINESGRLSYNAFVEQERENNKFYIAHEDYGIVKEWVLELLPNIIKHLIENEFIHECIIQNPPKNLLEAIKRKFIKVNEVAYTYNEITNEAFKSIANELKTNILGQEKAISEILSALYIKKINPKERPLVILLYGQEGIGKTETAKIISKEIDHHEMFRKQLSMFQTPDFGDFLFGQSGNLNTLARELLNRKSNVILLDEFDKCNRIFHSAFYQLFDEGIFIDRNNEVNMRGSIIICTSNYKSRQEIKEALGGPIYSRFDALIEYSPLSVEVKKEIITNSYEENLGEFPEVDQEIIKRENILEQLLFMADRFQNVREINKLVKLLMANRSMKKLLNNDIQA